jgi:hypothetical protein
MNLDLRAAMGGEWRPSSNQGDFGEQTTAALMIANAGDADSEKSALALLERENSGLRRLVVELLEKNQKLREDMHSRQVPAGCDHR